MYQEIVIAFPETFKLFLINIVIPISTELRSHGAVKHSFSIPFVQSVFFSYLIFQSVCQMEKVSYVVSLSLFPLILGKIRQPDNELSFSRSPPSIPVSPFVERAKSFPFVVSSECWKSDQIIRLVRYLPVNCLLLLGESPRALFMI